MKRCAMVLLACAALAGLVSGRAVAAIPVKVASSVGTSEQNYVNVTYGKLVELAQKYSGGAFEFQLYPDMRLGDEQKTVRALQHGDIQMSVLATNNFMPFAPSCGWLNMPYLFGSLEEFRKLVDLMWDQHNAWAVKESGARVLAIVDIGYRQLTTDAAHPVRNLADARGWPCAHRRTRWRSPPSTPLASSRTPRPSRTPTVCSPREPSTGRRAVSTTW